MARLVGVRQFWTFVFGYAAALAALIAGPAAALRMVDTPHATTLRAMIATLLGVGSLVPIIVLIAWMYRRSDEYERHGLLLTFAIGMALTLVAMVALDILAHTDLLQWWVWAPRWWTVSLCWLTGIVVVRTALRRPV